ncbi:hypothetical protein QF001_000961 [Paraburkholderia youngii]|uniref:hypothetical protein n=1 Tax=Paraburkholderia youngii TaxID=2782701 RepID=UPI003D23A052
MKVVKIALLAAALLVAHTSFALSTLGNPSCGMWVKRKTDQLVDMGNTSWLMGFMTGIAVGTGVDMLANADGESLELWMDNYCQAHPLDNVGTGAAALAIELRSRMPKK